MKTTTKKLPVKTVKKSIDETEAKRRELRNLERKLKDVNDEYWMIRGLVDEMRDQLQAARKMVAAEPDAVGQVIAGALAILKHFPNAESASLDIFSHRDDGRFVAFCQIPIPIPKKAVSLPLAAPGAEKGGVA